MSSVATRRAIALAYGVLCHGVFAVAILSMVFGLFTGMQSGLGRLSGRGAWLANAALLLQFPIIHSWLLSQRGGKFMQGMAPRSLHRSLAPTIYSLLGAVQVGCTFALWSPSGVELWRPEGWAWHAHIGAFVLAWAFLGKALFDAGLGLQTGWIGWTSAWRGDAPRFPGLPVDGLFRRCRQPIYLGFALTLWTGPVWTPDHFAIATIWSAYCALGPLLKERRFAARYGEAFVAYQREVPYFLPRLLP